MRHFIFDGVSSEDMGIGCGQFRRSIAPAVTPTLLTVPGRHGSWDAGMTLGETVISIDVGFMESSHEAAAEKRHALAAWLVTETPRELTLSDEPGMVWYARLDGSTDLEEFVRSRRGEITFVAADPYAYAAEPDTFEVTQGANSIDNAGGVPTPPVLELTVDGDTSFIDIASADSFVRVGVPAGSDDTPQEPSTLVWHDDMSEMDWTVSTVSEDGDVSGTMASNGSSFSPKHSGGSFGTGGAWHGPSVARAVTGDPLVDFQINWHAVVDSRNAPGAQGKITVYLLDVSDNVVAKIHLHDSWPAIEDVRMGAMLGPSPDDTRVLHNAPNTAKVLNRRELSFYVTRFSTAAGRLWQFFAYGAAGSVDPGGYFVDLAEEFDAPITKIAISMQQRGTSPVPQRLEVLDMTVTRINSAVTDDEPLVIARAGDTIALDNATGSVLLNGSPMTSITDEYGRSVPVLALCDLGSSFFELPVGTSDVTISADDGVGVTGTLSLRKRWL